MSDSLIKVEVKLVGFFQTGRFRQQLCEYPTGTSALQVFDTLRLPRQHLGIVLVNGTHAEKEMILNDGDHLVLMPLLGGG